MDKIFVKVCFDIDCEWEGLSPVYRIYVGDELFSERTWNYVDHYLKEILQIQAPPGRYDVRLESVGPNLAKFKVDNFDVLAGPARWKGATLKIYADES